MRDILSDDERRDDLAGVMMSDNNNDENYDNEDYWEEDPKPWIKPKLFLFIGGIIVVLLVLIFLLTGGGGGSSEVTIDRIHNIEMRIAQLEGKVSSFTDLTNRVSELENKMTHFSSAPASETLKLTQSIDKRIEKLENDILKLSSNVKTSAPGDAGDKQTISASAAPQTQTKKADKPVSHTVKGGETLYKIARDYGVPVGSIQKLNKLSGDSIQVGQKLIIKQ